MQILNEAQVLYDVPSALDQITNQALRLPPLQKIRLVERLMSVLEKELSSAPTGIANGTMPELTPRRSLFGALAHLGTAPSAEEIDEARRKAWANFPSEDV